MSKKVAEIVVGALVKAVEDAGSKHLPWQAPWRTGFLDQKPFCRPNRYTGFNQLLLSAAPFRSPFWFTKKDAAKEKLWIRPEEFRKSWPVIFTKVASREDEDGEEKSFRFLRFYSLWNLEQMDPKSVSPKIQEANEKACATPEDLDFQGHDEAERVLSGWFRGENPPTFLESSDPRAFYRPKDDAVHMPLRATFESEDGWYQTLFHEVVHSTGHPTRLSREFGKRFGTEAYSKEELIAEIGAGILLTSVGISPLIEASAAYLQGWLRALKADPMMLISAGSQAEKAAALVLSRTPAEGMAK